MRIIAALLLFLSIGLPSEGQTYYLPKTAVRFHLLIEKQTYTPGDFAAYAERYLHMGNIQQQEQVSHRVVNCQLTTAGVRDTTKCYTLRLKGKGEAADVRLSDDGILLAVNAEPVQPSNTPAYSPQSKPRQQSPKKFLSAEVLSAGSTAKMAELTVQQMLDLREHRQQLATGEAEDMPNDEKQLQLMLQQIDQQHDALMTLFTGTIRRDTTMQVVTLCPEQESEREVVFRLSRQRGLVDKDDLSGVPFYMTVKNLYPNLSQPQEDKKGDWLYVNLPGTASITLQQEDLSLATFEVPLAQFGHTEQRSYDPFKRYVTHLTLHPATGAVVKQFSDLDKK